MYVYFPNNAPTESNDIGDQDNTQNNLSSTIEQNQHSDQFLNYDKDIDNLIVDVLSDVILENKDPFNIANNFIDYTENYYPEENLFNNIDDVSDAIHITELRDTNTNYENNASTGDLCGNKLEYHQLKTANIEPLVNTNAFIENNNILVNIPEQPHTSFDKNNECFEIGEMVNYNEKNSEEREIESISPEFEVPKELKLTANLYNFVNIASVSLVSNIYENAIKKINFDEENLLKNLIIEEFGDAIKLRGFDQSNMNLSRTYSKIGKYILDITSSDINNIMKFADTPITPGMSISDIKNKCISNKIFFDKLHKSCKEIAIATDKIPAENFLHIIQSRVGFGAKEYFDANVRKISINRKNKFSLLLKYLVVNSLLGLPRKIKYEIENFSATDISNGLFVQLHGVYITKSFMRNMLEIYAINKSIMDDDRKVVYKSFYELFKTIKENLEKELQVSSLLFKERVYSPNDRIIKSITKYLISDIANIYFGKKSILLTENADETLPISFNQHRRYIDIEDIRNFEQRSNPQLPSTSSNASEEYEKHPSATRNISENTIREELSKEFTFDDCTFDDCGRYVLPEELILISGSYIFNYKISHTLANVSIYEYAIMSIEIDEKGLLKSTILEDFNDLIEFKGFNKSLMDISLTYSKISKYISNKSSPYINEIMKDTDILITPGMSISDIKDKCTSNKIFFDRLQEHCNKIEEDVDETWRKDFFTIIQSSISFGPSNNLNFSMKKISCSRRNKIYKALKFLIVNVIRNLPLKIKHTIGNMEPVDILKGEFVFTHNVYLTKSLIKNVANIYYINRNLSIEDPIIKENLEKKLCESITVYKETTFKLSKSMAKLLADYLLLDMNNIHYSDKCSMLVASGPAYHDKQPPASNATKEQHFGNKDNKITFDKNSTQDSWGIMSKLFSYEPLPSISDPQATDKGSQKHSLQHQVKYKIPKELKITTKLYSYNNIYSAKLVENMYEKIIKMTNFDERKLINETMLKVFNKKMEKNDFSESNTNFSSTHSNLRKYILSKVSPYINDIIPSSDVVIVNGMSTSDIKDKCISNRVFFDKLYKYCMDISEKIDKIPHEYFLYIIQGHIRINSGESLTTNVKSISRDKKNVLSTLSKFLILESIRNLPNKIISEIKKLDLASISEILFVKLHGTYLTRSFIRNLTKTYPADMVNKLLDKKSILEEKVKKALTESVVLHEEKALAPNEFMVELMTKHLLSDIVNFSLKNKTKPTTDDKEPNESRKRKADEQLCVSHDA
ncbi:hypothetical protein [Candidatus Ichthyocystis sparus]|uniref:hypothetical protein n=1 Tax=Candidatus Ichthyocystis sparus TaxID=1561004 RepID=UPI000B8805EF|nr:hypothetical protein [Candidatus Ichthyocystis sparus]